MDLAGGEIVGVISEEDLCKIWEWNSIPPSKIDACLHDLIAQNPPKHQAVISWDGELSFEELERLSTLLASQLVDKGVGPEELIPLCFEKSKWAIVAILAVLKAGGACVMMDPSHPPNRLNAILERIEAKFILHSPSAAHLITYRNISRTEVPSSSLNFVGDRELKLPQVKPNNAAWALFTSGSTGEPKVIIREHYAVCASSYAYAKMQDLGPGSRVFQFASYAFAVALHEIFASLVAGSCLCIPSEHDRVNNLAPTMRAMEITCACMTSSVAASIADEVVPTLQNMTLSGEPMARAAIDAWGSRVNLKNWYGSAEAASMCVGIADSKRPSTVGRGFETVVWIIDPSDHNRLSHVGEIGEIVAESHQLARGYLKNDEKTRIAFIENPKWLLKGSPSYSGRNGRVYKTGDLGQYNIDGTLKFLGRKDAQLKLRGQLIDTGDVEYHLQKYMQKPLAVDIVTPSGQKQPMLACFFGLGDTGGLSKFDDKTRLLLEQLDAHLSKEVPKYMIPTGFIALGHLPLNVSGKLDRMKLRSIGSKLTTPEMTYSKAVNSNGHFPVRLTPTQKTMQQLWSQVLGIQQTSISLSHSFFKLGGDSVNVMRLVTG